MLKKKKYIKSTINIGYSSSEKRNFGKKNFYIAKIALFKDENIYTLFTCLKKKI